MDNKLPVHITNEKDLEFYEAFISDMKSNNGKAMQIQHSNIPMTKQKQINFKTDSPTLCPDMLYKFLSNHIGKLIRIDFLIGNRTESKSGKLINVGKEYIVLKLFRSGCTMICDIKSIKFVTIVHDNDISKLRSLQR